LKRFDGRPAIEASIENEVTAKQKKRFERIGAIDALRGLVMVLMALDHSRDFFGDVRIRPEAIDTTTISLFFTRWVTHFCAPTFLFLAGVSAWMHGRKLSSRKELAWFLITRGVWLIFLEFTVVRFGLLFSMTMGPWFFIVIAAIGTSMILLGLLCWLPHRIVLVIGLIIVFGHNLLDGIQADQLGRLGWVWTFLHQPGYIPWAYLVVAYPVLPWFGLMAVGYGISPYLAAEPQQRRRFAVCVGLTLVAAFLLIRSTNVYGDSQHWSWQPVSMSIDANSASTEMESDDDQAETKNASTETDWTRTLFSFLATSKYPPSLQFMLMTIGPALLLLALFDWMGRENFWVRGLKVFGGVPLFFYLLHFYLLNLGALLLYWTFKGVLISPMRIDVWESVPPEYGFNHPGWLLQVYIGWIVVLAILFPLCLWFGKAKRRGKSVVWSYF
jgi:uncharacterized membrane protein